MDQVSICWSSVCRLNCNHRSLILKVGTPSLILSLFSPTGFCPRYQRLGLVLRAVWEGLQSGSAAVGASRCAHVSWCCFESWHHIFPRSVSRERRQPGKYKQILLCDHPVGLFFGGDKHCMLPFWQFMAYKYYLKSAERGHIRGAIQLADVWTTGIPGFVDRRPEDAVL